MGLNANNITIVDLIKKVNLLILIPVNFNELFVRI